MQPAGRRTIKLTIALEESIYVLLCVKHGFKNGWRDISKEELSANMYCIREINLIGMRFLCLPIELICGWQSKARCNTGCAVLNSDQEIPALLLNVSKIVIGFIASVRKEQSTFNSRAIYHGS